MTNNIRDIGKKYKIIYADPPWEYTSFVGYTERHDTKKMTLADNYYNSMPIEEIKNLPIKEIADDNSILFLWATFPQLPNAMEVIKTWGFEYRTVAFVWEKYDHTNNTPKKYGLGYYTKSNCEVVMLGRRGRFKRKSASVRQIIKSTIGKHSQKPDEVRKRIVQLCGDLPRIELFARIKVHGWDTWGNDERLKQEPLEVFT